MVETFVEYLNQIQSHQTLIFNDTCINKIGDLFTIDPSTKPVTQREVINSLSFRQIHNIFLTETGSMDDDLYRK